MVLQARNSNEGRVRFVSGETFCLADGCLLAVSSHWHFSMLAVFLPLKRC